MFERKNKEPIFVTPSKEIAITLEQEEMKEIIEKLFEKIAKENPKDKASWTIKVKSHEICGVFRKLDYDLPTTPSDTLKIMFQSEYNNGTFRLQ
jgi:hypothetical protein